MTDKERAIGALESVVVWMKTSGFDYNINDLKRVFGEVESDYSLYLQGKKNKKQ